MEFLTLSNGVKMPQEGFGVFQIPDHKEAKRCVLDALDTGYRLIDTAAAYMNENAVGEAVRESGVKREDVFVTSKVWVQDMNYEGAEKAIDASLSKLGFDYLDLMLLHQPMGDYYGAWRALEEAYKAGKLRAIGMANCYPQVIADMCLTVDIKPMVNQVEMHPFFQQQLNLDTMKEFGVVPQAWARLRKAITIFSITPCFPKSVKNTENPLLRLHSDGISKGAFPLFRNPRTKSVWSRISAYGILNSAKRIWNRSPSLISVTVRSWIITARSL